MSTLLTSTQKIYIAVMVAAIILVLIICTLYFYKKVWCKKHFKEATYLKINRLVNKNDYLLLNNYRVDFDDTHVGCIDHLLISKKYIFAINDFPLSGVIKGELKGRTISVISGTKKVTVTNNPLNYNINLIKRFALFNNLNQSFVKGIVVINDDAIIEIENTNDQFMMVTRKQLCKIIEKFDRDNEKNLAEESIVKFINKLNRENRS